MVHWVPDAPPTSAVATVEQREQNFYPALKTCANLTFSFACVLSKVVYANLTGMVNRQDNRLWSKFICLIQRRCLSSEKWCICDISLWRLRDQFWDERPTVLLQGEWMFIVIPTVHSRVNAVIVVTMHLLDLFMNRRIFGFCWNDCCSRNCSVIIQWGFCRRTSGPNNDSPTLHQHPDLQDVRLILLPDTSTASIISVTTGTPFKRSC